jgi:hypothetical protein
MKGSEHMAQVTNTGIIDAPSFVTARRALGISKTYIAMTVFMMVLAIAVWNPAYYARGGLLNNSTSNSITGNVLPGGSISSPHKAADSFTGLPFLAVPLNMIPAMMIASAVLILFVYDKNNGVLEYLLSLGMTQRGIYMRYLKATLLLVIVESIIFTIADSLYIWEFFGIKSLAAIIPVLLITIPFSLSIMAFMVIAMMAFSSLQKMRAGSNQPLGLVVGAAASIPGYFIPFALPFMEAFYADIAMIAIMACISAAFLAYSGKLIRREKFLP